MDKTEETSLACRSIDGLAASAETPDLQNCQSDLNWKE